MKQYLSKGPFKPNLNELIDANKKDTLKVL